MAAAGAGGEETPRKELTQGERNRAIFRALSAVPCREIRRSGVVVGTVESWDPDRIGPNMYVKFTDTGTEITSDSLNASRGAGTDILAHMREVLDRCADALDGGEQCILHTLDPGVNDFPGLQFEDGELTIELRSECGTVITIEPGKQKTRVLLEMIVEVFEEWLRAAESALGERTGRALASSSYRDN